MWIRGQNLYMLIKCERLSIRKSVSISHCIIGNECVALGTYSTVDKALKVLDQIQYNMEPFEHEPTMVFQMPQDEEVIV